jgi:hypothetical protein
MKRFLTLTFLTLMAIGSAAQFGGYDIPAYHPAPPKKGDPLPPILSGMDLVGPSFKYPFQAKAYQLAAKVPAVLYQQPCYCHCDRSVGHTSLHSCFESVHGAHCAACMKEAFYTYQMHKKGRSATQIREGIVRGEWEKIDLEKAASIN